MFFFCRIYTSQVGWTSSINSINMEMRKKKKIKPSGKVTMLCFYDNGKSWQVARWCLDLSACEADAHIA